MDPILIEVNQKIQASLDHFKHELSTIRAGRANPALIENIPIEVYDTKLKLNEVGSIAAPAQNLLVVQIWDAGVMQNVIKAIQEANIGLNPSFEGQLIRLPVPPLTSERREELIKFIHQKKEELKINLRKIRQEIKEGWEDEKKAGKIGEDELERRLKILQEILDKSSAKLDELGKNKEAELSEL